MDNEIVDARDFLRFEFLVAKLLVASFALLMVLGFALLLIDKAHCLRAF